MLQFRLPCSERVIHYSKLESMHTIDVLGGVSRLPAAII